MTQPVSRVPQQKPLYLSKSDFKVAQTCPAKLYYKKKGYPSHLENEYMELLAEGGYMVGELAQLLFPEGIEVKTKSGTRYAVEETKELLKRDKVTLFEPAIEIGHKIIRIDILVKDGNHHDLIEVKSKSYNSHEKDGFYKKTGDLATDWIEYLEDVTYQTMVLKEAVPGAEITPWLMMPDKAKCTKIEGLIGWFALRLKGVSSSGFKNVEVDFKGDHAALLNDDILTRVNCSKEVEWLMPGVTAAAQKYVESLEENLVKIETTLTKHCKACEFRCDEDRSKSGFHECWGALAEPEPHIFDLYHAGTVGGIKEPYINELIRQGKTCLYDFPLDRLTGKRGERQLIQIQCSKENREWISPDLKQIVQSWKYPLHFIDFETSRMAIPYHKGMRPYESIAFQWSCHTVENPGADPVHSEWINVVEHFPSFEFAETLMDQIGIKGTAFMWATHENTTLKEIFEQTEKFNHPNPDLRNWIALMAKLREDQRYRMVDMCALTREYYYHPGMKGSNSLKAVLPAVWNNNPYLHKVSWFKKYVGYENGRILDPYKTLEPIEIAEQAEVVQVGTGAMKAYQEMLYGVSAADPEIRKKWKELLLQYCELDTMAMVIVWRHWRHLLGL